MDTLVASSLAFLNKPFSEALRLIDEQGFGGIEVYYEGKHKLLWKEINNLLSSYDFHVYLHAPFSDLNIASFNETVLRESMEQIKSSLEVSAKIGAKVTTIHFGRYSPLGLSYPEEALKINRETIKGLSKFGEECGIDLGFENTPKGFGAMFGSCETLEKIIEETGINITLDIGHANTWDNGPIEFIKRLDNSIAHIHLHDNSGDSDTHTAIGKGVVDYKVVIGTLKEIKYKKALCLELLSMDDLQSSKERIEELLGAR